MFVHPDDVGSVFHGEIGSPPLQEGPQARFVADQQNGYAGPGRGDRAGDRGVGRAVSPHGVQCDGSFHDCGV